MIGRHSAVLFFFCTACGDPPLVNRASFAPVPHALLETGWFGRIGPKFVKSVKRHQYGGGTGFFFGS